MERKKKFWNVHWIADGWTDSNYSRHHVSYIHFIQRGDEHPLVSHHLVTNKKIVHLLNAKFTLQNK